MDVPERRTALYDEHLALGARMVTFAGYTMPLHYPAGAQAEHRAVREGVGLFDIDHMGQLAVTGPDALSFLNRVLTSAMRDVPLWGAQYSLLPYADAGLVDDVFLYRLPEAWWMVVNAANRGKDLRWLQAHGAGFDVRIADISDETYMLALQGPRAAAILQGLTNLDLAQLPFHTCARGLVTGVPALIGATGYTGEYGYEFYFPVKHAIPVWRALLAAGAVPCGLAARDSLRFEVALPLYGHEIGPRIDPFSARLGRFVDMAKGPFIGRDALLKIQLEGPARKLVGLEMLDPAVPREGYPVVVDSETVGEVTSGIKSPTLERFLALALVAVRHAAVGTELAILVRDKPKRAKIVPLPFYPSAGRRQK